MATPGAMPEVSASSFEVGAVPTLTRQLEFAGFAQDASGACFFPTVPRMIVNMDGDLSRDGVIPPHENAGNTTLVDERRAFRRSKRTFLSEPLPSLANDITLETLAGLNRTSLWEFAFKLVWDHEVNVMIYEDFQLQALQGVVRTDAGFDEALKASFDKYEEALNAHVDRRWARWMVDWENVEAIGHPHLPGTNFEHLTVLCVLDNTEWLDDMATYARQRYPNVWAMNYWVRTARSLDICRPNEIDARNWRLLDSNEEFVYDHVRPTPPGAGYAVTLVLRGHLTCRCLRAEQFTWYLSHTGGPTTWPWHHTVMEEYVQQLLVLHPRFVSHGGSSYGFVQTLKRRRKSRGAAGARAGGRRQ